MEKKADQQKALDYLETVSGEIQLLALNIAVAAAKLAHKNRIDVEVNQNLADLVNQATKAVKQMNRLLDAARIEKDNRKLYNEPEDEAARSGLTQNIETTMNEIIRDSEKIVRLLADAKKS